MLEVIIAGCHLHQSQENQPTISSSQIMKLAYGDVLFAVFGLSRACAESWFDLCRRGNSTDLEAGGMLFCQEVKHIYFQNVGTTWGYKDVKFMNPDNGTCDFSGYHDLMSPLPEWGSAKDRSHPLAPFDEPVRAQRIQFSIEVDC